MVLWIIACFFILNIIIWHSYVQGKVLVTYNQPEFEFKNSPIPYNLQNVLIWSIWDMWFCQAKHKVIVGSFEFNNSSILITAYKDLVTNKYSIGTVMSMQHELEYEEVMEYINRTFDPNPPLRLKYIRLIQLLEYYKQENFGGTGIILSSHVLNSTNPIDTNV